MQDRFLTLCLKYLANASSEAENQWLFELIQQDESYLKRFEAISEQWNAFDHIGYTGFDSHAISNRVKQQLRQDEVKKPSLNKKPILATICCLILLASGWLYYNNTNQPNWETYTTDAGKQKYVLLADSTEVWINANGSLAFRMHEGKRMVQLQGEAFFKVKRNESAPFIVSGKHLRTQVLGTSFNINTQNQAETVSVISGKVSVASAQGEVVFLERGDRVRTHANERHLIKDKLKRPENAIAWNSKEFHFDHTPLPQVFSHFSEIYGYRFQFSNESLKQCTVKAHFKDQSLKAMLKMICVSLDSSYEFDPDTHTIWIHGNGC